MIAAVRTALCKYRSPAFSASFVGMSGLVRHSSFDQADGDAPAEKRLRVGDDQDAPDLAVVTSLASQKKKQEKNKKKKRVLPAPCSPDDVLWHEIISLLGSETVNSALAQGVEWNSPFGFREELEVTASKLSSNGH